MGTMDKPRIKLILILLAILTVSTLAACSLYAYGLPRFDLSQLLVSPKELVREVERRTVVSEESAVISVVEQAGPSVVSIVTERISFDPFEGVVKEKGGIGTGFAIDKDLVLTNSHVVAAEAGYTVVTKDKRTLTVQKVYRDTINDLAILRIEGGDLPPIKLGDSDKIKVGQTVVAIGNALGRFDNTVTVGVVSAIGRGVTASGGGASETLENVIQTDAALNPGNSGGPLLNLSGQVIGINVAVTSGAENIGFSIPVNTAKPVIEGFRREGRIVRPFLGVSYVIIGKDLAKLRNLPEGAYVRAVSEGAPAAAAGIAAGDIIVELAGQPISERYTLAKAIFSHKVGETVEVAVSRGGKRLTLKAALGETPSE